MESEKLTIYNALNQSVGQAERSEVHSKGLWHRSVNYIVLDREKRTLIFQDSQTLNQFDKDTFFIKTNGGHVQGEDMESEMVRELREELGLEMSQASGAHFLGVYQVSFEPTENFINREFMYFYLVSFDDALEKVTMDESEVKTVIEVPIDETVELLTGDRVEIKVTAKDVNDTEKNLTLTSQAFKNFTDDALYLRLFLAAQDFCNGRDIKHIVI
jgi:isopentenyldiphosphate isomerase